MMMTEGLLRFDRVNENSWCFDMGYQTISVQAGMVLQVQLADHFQQAELIETPEHGLHVRLRGQQEYTLNPNERYLARMATKTVEELITETALVDYQNDSEGFDADTKSEIDALPF